MGILFKFKSNLSSNNKNAVNYPDIRFFVPYSHRTAQIKTLQKQLQIHCFGYQHLLKKIGLCKALKERVRDILAKYFMKIYVKYKGTDNVNLYTLKILKDWDVSKSADEKRLKYARRAANKYNAIAILETISDENREEICYCLKNMERILTKGSDDMVEEDYTKLTSYIHTNSYQAYIFVNQRKIYMKYTIIANIVTRESNTILMTLSLRFFVQKDPVGKEWDNVLFKTKEQLRKINYKTQRCVLVITESNVLKDMILDIEKNGRSLDEYWPELKLRQEYENAYEKLTKWLEKDIMSVLKEEILKCVKIIIAEVTDRESLNPVIRAMESFSEELIALAEKKCEEFA